MIITIRKGTSLITDMFLAYNCLKTELDSTQHAPIITPMDRCSSSRYFL